MHKFDIKAAIEECEQDDEVFNAFVDDWMKKHPDAVRDIISNYLTLEVDNKPGFTVSQEWNSFVENCAAGKYEDLIDRAYDEYKERKLHND